MARGSSRKRRALLSGLVLGALAACSADREPARGQLMLAMQTDMSLPKDVSSIRIQIKRLGASVFDRSYPVGDGAVKLPATLAVVASDNPSDTVELRVLAFRGDEVRTLNRTITTVPESRIALLRVPVQWLCDGFVTSTGDGEERTFESTCEPDEDGDRSCVAGSCVGVSVASSGLPDFEPEEVFGGAGEPSDDGRCFPTETCFDAGFDVVAGDDCTVELAASESDEANFALRTGLGADGICSERDCYVPLDGAAGFGFEELEGTSSRRRFQLPDGVCRAIDDGRAEALVASLACRTKTPSTPTCGPWSSVEGDGADSVIDGSTPGAGGAPGGGGQAGAPNGSGGDAGGVTSGGAGGVPAGEGGASGEVGVSGASGAGGEAGGTGGGPTASGTTPIALGWGHSCRITDGSLVCWGENSDGQLGDGTTVKRSLPVPVPGLTGVVSVALGRAHTCALDSTGSVWCWGNGTRGQIGTSDLIGSEVPTEVYQGVVSIAAGADHTCAATGAGNVVCWGDNTASQLGNEGAGTQSGEPVDVEGLASAISLSAFGGRTCALSDDGSVSCWGTASGEARTRVFSFAAVPPPRGVAVVEGIRNAVSVAVGGHHACAASVDGSLRCWGDNLYGQLGTRDNEPRSSPVLTSGIAGAVEVVAGSVHTCVRLDDGSVSCFGSNEAGQLGVPSGPSSSVPAAVAGVQGVTALSAGPRHVCALLGQDSTLCWGSNDAGQLGNGAVGRGGGEVPVTVAMGFDATRGEGRAKLALGFDHACAIVTQPGTTPWLSEPFAFLGGGNGVSTCAVDDASRVWCWGYGAFGNLGSGTTRTFGVPTLNGMTDVISISSSSRHACAVFGDHSVACWGDNFAGQLGNGTTAESWVPVTVSGATDAVEVVVGDYFSCALDSLGDVKCWGQGETGELGDGNGTTSLVPVSVALPQAAKSIGSGIRHACAVLQDDTVSCWGANDSNQMGDGTSYTAFTPVSVSGVAGAVRVDGGGEHTCALLASGGIKCWGYNFSGQLGAGLTDTYLNAVDVLSIDDAVAIDLGFNYTCAIRSGGFPMCWGDNAAGQLGTGTYDPSTFPVAVSGYGAGGVSGLLTSGTHSCLLSVDGSLACFGTNSSGELGIGNQDAVNVPTPVTRPGTPPEAGAVACWGDNNSFENGTATGRDNLVPRVVPSLTAVAVASGSMHTCALEEAGSVKCWGDNTYGQLGDVDLPSGITPVTVAGVANAHGIVAGYNHTCVLLEDGGVTCWGDNTDFQLGHDDAVTSGPAPVQQLPAGVVAIAAGKAHTCALLADGTASCWGDDVFAQLGSGVEGSPRATPGTVPGVSGLRALALGAYHACGVTHDGHAYCWGENFTDQLGDTASAGVSGPAVIAAVDNLVGIGAGDHHSCAVTANGTVYCWGTGYSGALGNAVTTSATPLEVQNLSGVLTVDLSGSFSIIESQGATSCALGFDGSVHCWGSSGSGLLGDGSIDAISVEPVRVLLP